MQWILALISNSVKISLAHIANWGYNDATTADIDGFAFLYHLVVEFQRTIFWGEIPMQEAKQHIRCPVRYTREENPARHITQRQLY